MNGSDNRSSFGDIAAQRRKSRLVTARQCLIRGSFFGASLLTLSYSTMLADHVYHLLPRILGNALFFFPQFMFPYGELVFDERTVSRRLFTASVASVLNFLQWGTLAVLFAWLTRNLGIRYAFPLAFVVVILVTILVVFVFGRFGIIVVLDGP